MSARKVRETVFGGLLWWCSSYVGLALPGG